MSAVNKAYTMKCYYFVHNKICLRYDGIISMELSKWNEFDATDPPQSYLILVKDLDESC